MKDKKPLYLVADPETGEAYVARLIPDKRRIIEPRTLPLVQILRVVNYPRQHAIQDKSVAMEIPAIPEGTFVRMAIAAELGADDLRWHRLRTYESSLRAAQAEALRLSESEKEREIIRRHNAGEYGRRRCVKSYTKDEIKYMMEQHACPTPEGQAIDG